MMRECCYAPSYDAAENVLNEGKLLATYTNAPSEVDFPLTDWLGTKRVTLRPNGSVATCWSSLAYGNLLTPCGGNSSDPTNLHFTGKERDVESGNDYSGARYYASNMGRFMSPDPTGGHMEVPQTLNRYAYTANGPVNLTNPTGLDSYEACDTGGGNCGMRATGFDSRDGSVQWANVQLEAGSSQAVQIGSDGQGGLEDINTHQAYTGSTNGSGVFFSNDGGTTSSMGIFNNLSDKPNTFQDAGWANGGALSGFTYTLTNSKLEANQTEAGSFTFAGTSDQAGAALSQAGFKPAIVGENAGQNEYRSPGSSVTGANSAHFNIDQINLRTWSQIPQAQGDMHFGKHNFGWNPISDLLHCFSDHAGGC
jgi:RHS repeat-associated protein